MKAKRSVFIFKTDNHIFSKLEEEIRTEIELRSEWVGKIQQLQKFPALNIIKITFDKIMKANKVIERGLLAFSKCLPKHDIKIDTFYITTCCRCYKIEDHSTNNCSKDKNFKICSNCSKADHTWKECKERNRKFTSCEGELGTLGMKCPVRKEIISQKRKYNNNTATTYKEAILKNTTAIQGASNKVTDNTEAHLKIYACILHAHFINTANPGSYRTEVNKI